MGGITILLLLLRLVIYIVGRSSGHSNSRDYGPVVITPLPQPPQPDYILVAIRAFAGSEMSPIAVKGMLLRLNVPDTDADEVIDIAQKVCKALRDKEQHTDYAADTGQVNVLQRADSTTTYPVLKTSKPAEQYAGFYKMLFGESKYQEESTHELIYFMCSYSSFLPPVKSNDRAQIFQISFGGFGGRFSAVRLRTIKVNDRIVNTFPYMATKSLMPLITSEVIEWDDNTGVNSGAEIKATRRDNTELSFFATDYAVNRERYLNNAEISVRISAFAYDICELNPHEHLRTLNITAPPKIPDLTGTEKLSMHKFAGRVVKMKKILISEDDTAYILTLKLFENTDRQIYNLIDVFVNAENITSGEMQQNIVVKGTFWLQGELVNF